MNKGLWALSTAMLLAMTSAQAKQKVCVFDLLGKAGESYKMMEEWKLSSKTWQADIDLIAYQDEGKAQQDFDETKAAEMAAKIRENTFNFNDFIEQMDQVTNMGPLEDLLKMIPGMSNVPGLDQMKIDPKDVARKQFNESRDMMNKMSKGNFAGMEGLLGQGPKGKMGKLAMQQMARRMNKKKKKKK